jgi:hypothetical protein
MKWKTIAPLIVAQILGLSAPPAVASGSCSEVFKDPTSGTSLQVAEAYSAIKTLIFNSPGFANAYLKSDSPDQFNRAVVDYLVAIEQKQNLERQGENSAEAYVTFWKSYIEALDAHPKNFAPIIFDKANKTDVIANINQLYEINPSPALLTQYMKLIFDYGYRHKHYQAMQVITGDAKKYGGLLY